MVSGTVSRMGWSWACVRRSRTRSRRCVSSEACGNDLQQRRFAQVMRAGTRHQNASGAKQFERAAIDLFVSSRGRFQVPARLGEGRRIQHHEVEAAMRRGMSGQQSKTSASRNSMLPIPFRFAVAFGGLKARRRAVHGFHRFAPRGQVQRESAGGGEAIERPAFGIACRGEIVLALVEKDAGLLTVHQIGVQLEAVHFDRRPHSGSSPDNGRQRPAARIRVCAPRRRCARRCRAARTVPRGSSQCPAWRGPCPGRAFAS